MNIILSLLNGVQWVETLSRAIGRVWDGGVGRHDEVDPGR